MNVRVRTSDITRVLTLYALRYEQSTGSELRTFKEMVLKRGGPTEQEGEVFKACLSRSDSFHFFAKLFTL